MKTESGIAREVRQSCRRQAEALDDEAAKKATKFEWLCASTDPRRDRYANEMAGRKLHAVPVLEGETLKDLRHRKSRCGRRPKHGWCIDLFNDPCEACMKKTGDRP